MARETRDIGIAWAAIGIGGLLAGLILPKLVQPARRAGKRLAGMTFTSGVSGGPRPAADPARGRPA